MVLDGTGSSDLDDDDLTYAWSLNGQPLAIGLTPTINLALGTYMIDLVVNDGELDSPPDQVAIQLVDTTAPDIAADLVEFSKSAKSKKSGNRFRAELSAADNCDLEPVITTYIIQPITPTDIVEIRYNGGGKKSKKSTKSEIQIDFKKDGIRVTLKGPDETALRQLWDEAVVRGGFSVVDGQELKLVATGGHKSKKDDEDPGKLKFTFDEQLNLSGAHADLPTMVA